jgi:hypothetical protein
VLKQGENGMCHTDNRYERTCASGVLPDISGVEQLRNSRSITGPFDPDCIFKKKRNSSDVPKKSYKTILYKNGERKTSVVSRSCRCIACTHAGLRHERAVVENLPIVHGHKRRMFFSFFPARGRIEDLSSSLIIKRK